MVYVHLHAGELGNPHALRTFYFSDSEGSIIITCQKYVMKAEGKKAACLRMLNPMRNSSSQGVAVPI